MRGLDKSFPQGRGGVSGDSGIEAGEGESYLRSEHRNSRPARTHGSFPPFRKVRGRMGTQGCELVGITKTMGAPPASNTKALSISRLYVVLVTVIKITFSAI